MQQQPLSDAAAAAEATRTLEQQRAAIKPAAGAAINAPASAASGVAAAAAADPSSGSKRTAAEMSAKTTSAAAAAGSTVAAAASATGPNKENDTQMEPKSALKPVSPPALISAPPAQLPAPAAQPAVVVPSSIAPSSQLCSEELGGSDDPAERLAAESKRQRKTRGELSEDPKDWTEQIARNQAAVKELNVALEAQRQLNTDIERSLRRAHLLVSWTLAQAERQVNNETQAQLLDGDGVDAAAAAAAPASVAASSSSAAAVPSSIAAEFAVHDREEELFAAAIAAQDDPMALRTVPAQSSLDPALNMNQPWSWMSLQFRMDIDARHVMLQHAKAFNASLTQELADARKWADRVAESAERRVEQMSLVEPMRAEIKLRIQQKAEAMIAAVVEKESTEVSATAPAAESASSSAAAAPAESSAAAASKQQ